MEWESLDWSALLLALIAGFIGIAGASLNQQRANKDARRRDQESWVRDVRLRAHMEFVASLDAATRAAADFKNGHDIGTHPSDDVTQRALYEKYLEWNAPLKRHAAAITLVSEPATIRATNLAAFDFSMFAVEGGSEEQAHAAREQYIHAVREELGIPHMNELSEGTC